MPGISCVIIEDEPNAMKLLEDHIQKLPVLVLKQKFFDAGTAISFLKEQPADVIFLDINLPGMSGMDMAALLPAGQKIIFTTAYAEHALESFSYHVVDYLLKPISFRRFAQAVQKLGAGQPEPPNEQATDRHSIFVKSGRELLRLEWKNILYIEALREYISIQTRQHGKVLVYKRMKEMEALLPAEFVRIHNSYIINLASIEKITGNELTIDGRLFPVSNSYRTAFQQRLQKQLL